MPSRCWIRRVTVSVWLLGAAGAAARAQVPGLSAAALPDAPGVQTDGAQPEIPQRSTQALASLSGTVIDSDGDAIAGAQVTLSGPGLKPERTVVADGEGYFSFAGLPAGEFKLSVSAPGFALSVMPLTLGEADQVETPDISLHASAEMNVEVSVTEHDLAEEQIHDEEQQRLYGFIPNFFVTYDWKAVPLTARQKFRLASREAVDPASFGLAGIIAGIEQATNAFAGYGQGAAGFGKRYGATLADGTIGTLLGGAVFPALLRQDPRYFYKGTGSIVSRTLYALSTAFICKGDNGKWQPNWASFLADIATGALSNTYYPATDRNGVAATIEVGLLNAAEEGFGNVLQELLLKHLSTGVKK